MLAVVVDHRWGKRVQVAAAAVETASTFHSSALAFFWPLSLRQATHPVEWKEFVGEQKFDNLRQVGPFSLPEGGLTTREHHPSPAHLLPNPAYLLHFEVEPFERCLLDVRFRGGHQVESRTCPRRAANDRKRSW